MKSQQHAVILGAGFTGLSTGWKLAEANWKVTVLDIAPFLGGLASTFRYKDMMLDFGPHKIYSQIPGILDEYRALIGQELQIIPKKSRIFLRGRLIKYPVGVRELFLGMPLSVGLRCAWSYGLTLIRNSVSALPDDSYESWIRNRFGSFVYELVFGPYARKIWGDPSQLSAELARRRVVIPSLKDLILRTILGDRNKRELSAKEFHYPQDGMIQLSERMAELILARGGEVLLNTAPLGVQLDGNRVASISYLQDGTQQKTIKPDFLISTIPPSSLFRIISPALPTVVVTAANNLKFRSMILFYIVFRRNRLFDDCWLFFPEERFIFNRLSEQKAFSEKMIPPEKTVLCAEITCSFGDERWNAQDSQLFEPIMRGLEEAGLAQREDVIEYFTRRIRTLYPIYNMAFQKNLETILAYVDEIQNLYTSGRPGLFNYNNTDGCMDMGKRLANHLVQNRTKKAWREDIRHFDEYRIVD